MPCPSCLGILFCGLLSLDIRRELVEDAVPAMVVVVGGFGGGEVLVQQFEPRAAVFLTEAECDDALLAGRPGRVPAVADELGWTDFEVFAGDGAGDLLWGLARCGVVVFR